MLFSGARIIILDEPTSALSPPEVERLFGLLRRLRDAGRSIVFISHFLDDVLAICDRVTVFRNGRTVATEACAAIDKRWIIDRMIGAGHDELEESYTRRHSAAQPAGRQGGAGDRWAEPRGRVSRRVAPRCAPARCWAFMASSAAASSNWRARCSAACRPTAAASTLDGRARAAVLHDARTARRHRVRAGKPPR